MAAEADVIGSLRGLVVAVGLLAILAFVAQFDLARTAAPEDRALLPGFDVAKVTGLVWSRGGQTIEVARNTAGWTFRSDPVAPADSGAIGEVLAALRGARWHRTGGETPTHATLTVTADGSAHTFGIGEPLAGTEQVWLVDRGRGLLVDGWVARALDRDRLGLAVTTPFADAARAGNIVIQGGEGVLDIYLGEQPRRMTKPAAIELAAEPVSELEHALAAVTLVRAIPAHARGLTIALGGNPTIVMEIGGACPGAPELVAIAGTLGEGCIARPVAVEQAIARLRGPPAELVERRAVSTEMKTIALPDGTDVRPSPPTVRGVPADPARVTELVAALAAPNEPVALPASNPLGTISVTTRDNDRVILDLYPERVLARRGEVIALRPAPGAWAILVRPWRELRDLALWLEEPTTITAVAIDAVTYRAGSVLGEWTRDPAGPVDPKAVQALVDALAAPHATGFVDGAFTDGPLLTITVQPPNGKPLTHKLVLGPAGPTCTARHGIDKLVFLPALCTAARRLLR